MQWLLDGIRDIWHSFVEFIHRQVVGAFELIAWAVQSVLNGVWSVISYCLQMAWDFGFYIYDLFLGEDGFVWYLFDLVIWLGEWALSLSPDIAETVGQYSEAFGFTMRLVGMMDRFFPVTESAVLFATYMAFMFIVLVFRWTIKLIPGLGG